jgi:hypothetical protein
MKHFGFLLMYLLLASMSALATFDLDDPAQPPELDETGQPIVEEGAKPFFSGGASKQGSVTLGQGDYLKLIVGNYVHGFKEFDTAVKTSDDSVRVGVYYAGGAQGREGAEQLAEQFRQELPLILDDYKWAKEVTLIVYVYDKSRLN